MSIFTDYFEDINNRGEILYQEEEDYKNLKKSFLKDDIVYIFNKLKEYSPNISKKYLRKYLNILLFISYYYEENTLTKEEQKINNILNFLKEELKIKVQSKDLEYYTYILRALFPINKLDKKYYIEEYDKLKENGFLYSDIISRYVFIFKEIENKDYFIDSYKNLNLIKSHGYGFEAGLDYLLFFNDKDFSKYFTDFIKFYIDENNKEKLVKHYRYEGIFSNKFNSKLDEKILKLLEKISKNKNSNLEKLLFNFIKSEISFSLKRHGNSLIELNFVLTSLDYLLIKDKTLYLNLFSDVDFESWSFEFADFLSKYIKEGDESIIFEKLKEKGNEGFILHINDYLKRNKVKGQSKIIKRFKEYKEVKNAYKQREKAYKENDTRIKKEIQKEKNDILLALKDVISKRKEKGEIFYSPKLVYEYKNKQLDKEKDKIFNDKNKLDQIFTKIQFGKIENEVKKSIQIFFGMYEKHDYKWFFDNLEYNQLEGNRVSYPSVVLDGTLDIFLHVAFNLKIDLSKYKKTLLGFIPFLSLSKYENIEDQSYFTCLKSVTSTDIDYILSIYSVDRDSKDDTRYCQTENIFTFFTTFKSSFSDTQKKKFYKILNSFIFNDKLYSHFNIKSLEFLKESGKKQVYFNKLFNDNYTEFNYFKNILTNLSGIDKKEIEKYEVLTKINEILIEKYKDERAIKWRVKQLKDGMIAVEDTLKITYPQKSSYGSSISDAYSELYSFGSKNESFTSVIKHIKDIKYKDSFLGILKQSFEILREVENEKIDKNYKRYGIYLQEAFFNYLEGFEKKEFKYEFYEKIKKCIKKFNNEITYNFNYTKLDKIFGRNYRDKAKEIYDEGFTGIERLLREKDCFHEKNKKLINDNKRLNKRNINNNLADNIILYVEGIIDKDYLDFAYSIYNNDFPKKPIIIPLGGVKAISNLLNSVIGNKSIDSKIIGMLDFDFEGYSAFEKGDDFNDVKEVSFYNGKLKKHKESTIYKFLLPVPDSGIKKQVLIENSDKCFKRNSNMYIEHLFFDNINDQELINTYFDSEFHSIGWSKIIHFKPHNKNGKKQVFKRKIIENAKKEIENNGITNLFNNFRPILGLIENIRNNRY